MMHGGMLLVWSWAGALFAALGGMTYLALRLSGRDESQFFRRYLLKGVLVALVLVPAALGPPAFGLSLATLACVFAHEVTSVLGRLSPAVRRLRWLGALGPAFLCLVTAAAVRPAPSWLPLVLGIVSLVAPWFLPRMHGPQRVVLAYFLGVLWPGLALFAISWLVARDTLLFDVAFLYGVLEANTLCSSVADRLFGQRPFARSLEVRKTWEGLFAGLAGAALAGFGLAFTQPRFTPFTCVLLGLGLAFLGIASELTAALLKRTARVNGFSAWLGPQGGFMDAYEGFVLVGPLWCALLSFVQVRG
jgi:CDP-diglyceride synthetase